MSWCARPTEEVAHDYRHLGAREEEDDQHQEEEAKQVVKLVQPH